MVDLEARSQWLGFPTDHLFEGALVPVRIAPIGRLFLDHLLLFGVLSGLLQLRLVHHDVLRRLSPDRAFIIETSTAGTPSNLRELTVAQDARGASVVFAELREQHRADRDVDANAQRVSTADDLEKAGLREPFYEESIFWQQPGVVHADACHEEPSEALAERRVEAESADQFFNPLLLFLRERVEADVALCCFGRVALREVNEVNRCSTRLQERLDRGVEQRCPVLEVERHRSLRRLDQNGLATGPLGQFVLEKPGVAKCRRHQQELTVRKFKDRQLPCPTALRVGIEMELVGDDDVDISPVPVTQCPVREDLGSTTDDRCVRVDRTVAGDHPHLFRPKLLAQLEKLLAHQRLDRCGVDAALVAAQTNEMRSDSHERLARPGRRVEDDVAPGNQLESRFFLRRVHLDALLDRPVGKTVEQRTLIRRCAVRLRGQMLQDRWANRWTGRLRDGCGVAHEVPLVCTHADVSKRLELGLRETSAQAAKPGQDGRGGLGTHVAGPDARRHVDF